MPTEDETVSNADCLIVINRQSGTVSEVWNERFKRELLAAFESNGWKPDSREVAGGEIEQVVDEAIASGVSAIIAGGGDGTVTSIAAKLRGTEVALGILPFGTLNIAARDLKTPLDPMEAIRSLKPGRTREIDVMEVNGTLCLCLTVLGVYPDLLNRSEEFHGQKWWMKFVKILPKLSKAFFKSPRFRVKLTLDDETTEEVKTCFLIITPGKFEDEIGVMPRRNGLSNGKCSVYVSEHSSRYSAVRMLVRFFLGRGYRDPDLKVFEASRLDIAVTRKSRVDVAIDGELSKLEMPAEFDLRPLSLTVLDPDSGT